MRVTFRVFVVLFVLGTVMALGVGFGKRRKTCSCSSSYYNREDGRCPGQCACGAYPQPICREKPYTLDPVPSAIVLLLSLAGLIGFTGAFGCLCVMCCYSHSTSSNAKEHQLAQPHTPYGAQPGYPVLAL